MPLEPRTPTERKKRMKGIVFVCFIEMVEEKFGLETTDRIIELSELSTNGAYTSVGTYDHTELIQLVSHLSKLKDVPVTDLVKSFGKHMFNVLASTYPAFIENVDGVFSLLSNVENVIHVEVRKLYPDAELPRFSHRFMGEDRMELIYSSPRPFSDFAHGLIEGCIEYFSETASIESVENLPEDASSVRFVLVK